MHSTPGPLRPRAEDRKGKKRKEEKGEEEEVEEEEEEEEEEEDEEGGKLQKITQQFDQQVKLSR